MIVALWATCPIPSLSISVQNNFGLFESKLSMSNWFVANADVLPSVLVCQNIYNMFENLPEVGVFYQIYILKCLFPSSIMYSKFQKVHWSTMFFLFFFCFFLLSCPQLTEITFGLSLTCISVFSISTNAE